VTPNHNQPKRAWSSLTRQAIVTFLAPILALAVSALAVNALLEDSESQQREARRASGLVQQHYRFVNNVEAAASAYRRFLLAGQADDAEAVESRTATARRILDQWRSESHEREHAGHSAYVAEVSKLFERWRKEVAWRGIERRRHLPVGLAADAFVLHARFNRLATMVNRYRGAGGALWQAWRDSFHSATLRLERMAKRATNTQNAQRWRELRQRANKVDQRLGASYDRVDEVTEAIGEIQARVRHLAEEAAIAELTLLDTFQAGPSSRLIERITTRTEEHLSKLETRQTEAIRHSVQSTRVAQWVAILAPAVGLLVGLAIAVYLISRVITDIRTISRAARRVAEGTLTRGVELHRQDEIGELANSFNRMSAVLAARHRSEEAFDAFQSGMLAAHSTDEAVMIVERFADTFFPGTRARIYRMAESRNRLDRIGGWGEREWPPEEAELAPDDCLGLRTGHSHEWGASDPGMPCPHHGVGEAPLASVCIPLAGRDQSMGLITIGLYASENDPESATLNRWMAHRVAEQLGLVLSNLELRERLRSQSIRDALTGLFNRRYLDETLDREIARSVRYETSLAVMTIDVDHFKSYNDNYGHEAGDHVLTALARRLASHVRGSDIACRAGGEEFVLVLPDADESNAAKRAEEIRAEVAAMRLAYGEGELPGVTISVGVAAIPPERSDAASLLRQADRALYRAKRQGRDRVVLASSSSG
jgi:diguanylate cyclase (GGDEF)-like protein